MQEFNITNTANRFLTEEMNKVALSANDDKRIQSMDLVETHAYRISKDLICKKETKLNVTI